jgi:hypothetical protein
MVNRDGEQKTDQINALWCEKKQVITCSMERLEIDVSDDDGRRCRMGREVGLDDPCTWNPKSWSPLRASWLAR